MPRPVAKCATIDLLAGQSTIFMPNTNESSDSLISDQPVDSTSSNPKISWNWWLEPALVLLVITVLCTFTQLDIWVSSHFYSVSDGAWNYRHTLVSDLIYEYSPIPGIAIGIFCLIFGVLGLVFRQIRSWSNPALFCSLVLLLGPAILVNGIMKPTWGRPRPNKIEQFGGHQKFVPPGQISGYESARSFPSGHASMGFIFMAPAFLLLHKNRKAAYAWLAGGLFAGASIGLSRIADGSHFLSDIAWSGGIVYFSGLMLYLCLRTWLIELPKTSMNDVLSSSVLTEPTVLRKSNKDVSDQDHQHRAA